MKILWLSQHDILDLQVEALRQIFGKVEMCQDVNPFSNAQEIKNRFDAGGYDDLLVVAPLSVIRKLCELELYPLWADTIQIFSKDKSDFEYRGRYYKFLCIKRVKAVEVVFFDEVVPLEDVYMIDCEFCTNKVKEPKDLNTTLECPNCQAIYWLECEDDMYDVNHHAAEHFQVEEWQVEVKIRKNFITFDEGDNWHLVFARQKMIETNPETEED
ncbi:MAG: hypothetical protein ABIJ91_04005 [Candidatus Kuenenbacteria bacterium]